MQFWHEGAPVTHPGLHRAFLRGVRFLEDPGVFVVQVGRFRGQIEVEDTPWWVVGYDPELGEIELTDRTREPLLAETLAADPDGVLRCTVKQRFAARFTRAGQAALAAALEETPHGWTLRAGAQRLQVPAAALP